MARVRFFNLKPGNRIGNYRIIENFGRGWERDAHKIEEVLTEAMGTGVSI